MKTTSKKNKKNKDDLKKKLIKMTSKKMKTSKIKNK